MYDVLAARLSPAEHGVVVDLGCGPGHTLAAIRERFPGTCLVGIDLASAALAAARQASVDAALVRADLCGPLPLRDGVVDALICHNLVELLPDPAVLFAEARRVLRPGGRAVWSHTDFAGLVIHGADQDLTDLVCRAYAEIPQRWMSHIDPRAGRKLPGLARRAGLTIDAFDAHVLTADRLAGHARRRIDEITEVACRHVAQERVALTVTQVQEWRAQLDRADADGDFCFAVTAFVTTTSNRPG